MVERFPCHLRNRCQQLLLRLQANGIELKKFIEHADKNQENVCSDEVEAESAGGFGQNKQQREACAIMCNILGLKRRNQPN